MFMVVCATDANHVILGMRHYICFLLQFSLADLELVLEPSIDAAGYTKYSGRFIGKLARENVKEVLEILYRIVPACTLWNIRMACNHRSFKF